MRALLDEVPIGRSEVLRTTSRGSRLIERGPSTAWAKETGTSIPIGRSITPTLDPRQISTAEQRAMTMCRADIAFTATRSNKAVSQMYPSVGNRGRPPAIMAICPGLRIAASSMPPSSVMMSFSYTDYRIRKTLRDTFMRREQTFRGDEEGSALIEAAILTPLLIVFFVGVFEFSWLFYQQ